MSMPTEQNTNNTIVSTTDKTESALPIGQHKIQHLWIYVVLSLEIICVLGCVGLIWYARTHGPYDGYGGYIFLYYMLLPLISFEIFNIIGYFVASFKITDYKKFDQQPPIILKLFRKTAKIIFLFSVILIALIVLGFFG